MIIYHGSESIIDKPVYGFGKPYNDYGIGFYCTESIEMAKEWAVDEERSGFANEYDLDTDGLKILRLSSDKYSILHWITILLKNRTFRVSNPLAKQAKQYLLDNFLLDIYEYDVVIGYRADDSYFSFAEDFLNNTISVKKLSEAMRLGNLGEQVVLISEKAFKQLHFKFAHDAEWSEYYSRKTNRNKRARNEYLNSDRASLASGEMYILDILRQEVKPNNESLR